MNEQLVVVVGDVLLDVDVQTRADRLVPDAPAPVLDEVGRQERPGGAALAAMLAARHPRQQVVLVAPMADDDAAARVHALLPPAVEVVAIPCQGRTPVKTRLRARGQTVARLDGGGGASEIGPLTAAAREALHSADAVLVSDYGGGATGHEPLRAALARHATHTPTVWDPHPRGSAPVAGVALVTPNAAEAATLSGLRGDGVATIRRQAEALLSSWRARSVAVTLGSRGALLSYGNGASEIFPARPVNGGDPCGAGDCFGAAAVTALAGGAVPSEAVSLAVDAASRFVAAGGASGLDEPPGGHTVPRQPRAAADLAEDIRAAGGIVVATGGCFDIVHAGHIATLSAARALGDCLIVCLNSDASVRRLKGDTRPLQPAEDRMRVLQSLRDVDAVVVFDEDTPTEMLRGLRPHIWVKGGDYAGAILPEAELLRQWGGEVVTVPYLRGRSTSELVERGRV